MLEIENEQHEQGKPASELIRDAASSRGLEISDERLCNLVAYNGFLQTQYSDDKERGEKTPIIYNKDGLIVKRPIPMRVGSFASDKMSRIDFIPIVGDDNTIANPHPQRGKTSEITLSGIRAFQDLVLLSDAGLVEKPERFYGLTNPTMARFAKRVGFVPTPSYENGVTVSFDTVAERIFSPEIARVEQMLQARLGNVAVSAKIKLLQAR